jgi:hypothetical protein
MAAQTVTLVNRGIKAIATLLIPLLTTRVQTIKQQRQTNEGVVRALSNMQCIV